MKTDIVKDTQCFCASVHTAPAIRKDYKYEPREVDEKFAVAWREVYKTLNDMQSGYTKQKICSNTIATNLIMFCGVRPKDIFCYLSSVNRQYNVYGNTCMCFQETDENDFQYTVLYEDNNGLINLLSSMRGYQKYIGEHEDVITVELYMEFSYPEEGEQL